jgi:hypothetical protein
VESILEAIGNTPLVRLHRCAPPNGAELWLKLEYVNRPDRCPGVVTAIAGSVAGANLALIVLDIAWDRQRRDRFSETSVKGTQEPRPSTV